MLKVTNRNEFDLHDRFNGVDYAFPKGGSTVVDEDVAKHIFGFGAPDKIPYLTRLGWMQQSRQYDEAMQKMAGFVFGSAEETEPGELAPPEQGLAPLQPGAGDEAATDGVVESSVPIPARGGKKGRSVLAQLAGG